MDRKLGVTYVESFGITGRKVGESILRLAPTLALAMYGRDCHGPRETNQYSLFFGDKISKVWGIFKQPRPYIADLDMADSKDGKRWLLKVYGRSYIGLLRDLADALSREYNVAIHIRLESENAKEESFNPGSDL